MLMLSSGRSPCEAEKFSAYGSYPSFTAPPPPLTHTYIYIHTHVQHALPRCVATVTHTLSCGAVPSFWRQTAGRAAPVSPFTHIGLINSFTAKCVSVCVCLCVCVSTSGYLCVWSCSVLLNEYILDQRLQMCRAVMSLLRICLFPLVKDVIVIVLLKGQFYCVCG